MAGNAKFQLSSVSSEDLGFAGSIANGTRGAHLGASLNRFGSFRENSNGRSFSSGGIMSKGKTSDLPPLSQCLTLDPLVTADLKCSRSSELKRALGLSFGNFSEDSFFRPAHSRLAPSLSIDEFKRFRETILDENDNARTRVKRLDENLNKLTGYLRKVQIIERFSSPNFLKPGAPYNVKAPDLVMHKVDDRVKNVMSKRARTPVADMRVEGRGPGIPRQHMVLAKDRDMKQGSLSSDSFEEKMRTLPAGGESWDRKMKRKRSVSNGFPRPIDGDGEIKRALHGRLDAGVLSSEAPAFRASSNGSAGNNKSDGSPSASGSSIRQTPRSDTEKLYITRELGWMNKERILPKGNNKLNVRDGHVVGSPSLISKGKASRGLRSGLLMVDNTSPTLSHMASTPEEGEPPNVKRALSSESSSPPMAQWVGQRPQKVSRIRKTDIISPTSNNDEAIITSEGCTSGGMQQHIKGKSETTSPARLSEVEETGAAENRDVCSLETEENGSLSGISTVLLTKKTKLLVKEEIGDSAHRLGRNGRGASFSRGIITPLGRELDSPTTAKLASDKNGSKSGRPPLRKHSEHKGFTPRLSGLAPNGKSPDRIGRSDNDREDLLAAAQFTSNGNNHACSSSFWKDMEPLFSITADDRSYLIKQLKELKEHQGSPSEMLCNGDFNEGCNGGTSLYQRLLSALIVEDQYEEPEDLFSLEDNGAASFDDLLQEDYNFMQPEAEASPTSSQGHYAQMSIDEKVQAELQTIGLHPQTVNSDLAEGEDEVFSEEISELKNQFHQEVNKKKSHLERIWKAVEVEKELRQWEFEQAALNRLVVLAYRKLLATRGSTASKIGVNKVPRNVALSFVKRTLARCRKFQDTGKSCFSEPPLWDVILGLKPAGSEQLNKPERDLFGSSNPLPKTGPLLNRGKKRELMLDDVGNGGNSTAGMKGKRNERDRDKESPAKSSRPSRKTKPKPKQRGANQSSSTSTHPVYHPSNGSIRKQLGADEVDPVQIDVENELAEHQDLGSWLDFEDGSLQDHDSMGLEIPMDDLSELSMIL